ncbi:MAG: hypothetical protein EOO66_14855 [Methylobacterium sp.]|nr:MAG: hypothetical protein EOO66_14855 [Methylobacterium sp.]
MVIIGPVVTGAWAVLSDVVMAEYVTRAAKTAESGTAWSKRGEAQAAIDGAARTFTATYMSAHVAQVTLIKD